MRRALVALLALTACGRRGFEPPGSTGDDVADGDGGPGDGTPGDSSTPMIDAPMIDAPPPACAAAITIPLGRTASTSTCTHGDRLDGCPAAAKQEVIFKFVAPATASYTFGAYDPGTQNIMSSTKVFDASCMPTPGCAALTGRGFTAGDVVYFVVESSSSTCSMIEFDIKSP